MFFSRKRLCIALAIFSLLCVLLMQAYYQPVYVSKYCSANVILEDGSTFSCTIRICGNTHKDSPLGASIDGVLVPKYVDTDGIFINDQRLLWTYNCFESSSAKYRIATTEYGYAYLDSDADVFVAWLRNVQDFFPEFPEGSAYVILTDNTIDQYTPCMEAIQEAIARE